MPKGSTKILDLLCKTYHANDRDNNMSLFNNSSRQLRRITEQSISMLKVSQNGNTIQHLSFLPSIKSKTYHGRYEKYTTKKTSDISVKYNTQLVVFILKELQIVPSSPRQKYFSCPTKNTFHSQREK